MSYYNYNRPNYTRADHQRARQIEDTKKRSEDMGGQGDYEVSLSQARRERIYSTPLARRLYGRWY